MPVYELPVPYRLRIPGPIPVPSSVRLAMAEPVIAHRGPYGRALFARFQQGAKALFGCAAPVMLLGGSGTTVMEAAIVNLLPPGSRVLSVNQGAFGKRFTVIARENGYQVRELMVPWGTALNVTDISDILDEDSEITGVLITHNESSTGVETDLRAVGAVCKGRDVMLIVDSVSGAGGTEVRVDEWGVDALVTATQKALMCPPGAGLVALGPRAINLLKDRAWSCGYYYDFWRYLVKAEDDQTPFTPPLSLMKGLCAAFDIMEARGAASIYASGRALTDALSAGLSHFGFAALPDHAVRSRTVVVACLPDGIEMAALVAEARQRGTMIAGAVAGILDGALIRIGVMGEINFGDICEDLTVIGASLQALGHLVDIPGALSRAAASLTEAVG